MSSPPQVQRDMPVHCATCGAFNERAALVCTACGEALRFKCRHCQALNLRTTSRCTRCQQLLRLGDWDLRLPKLQFQGWRWHWEWLKRRFDRWTRPAVLLLVVGIFIWLVASTLWNKGVGGGAVAPKPIPR